jgi:hypothetical protein
LAHSSWPCCRRCFEWIHWCTTAGSRDWWPMSRFWSTSSGARVAVEVRVQREASGLGLCGALLRGGGFGLLHHEPAVPLEPSADYDSAGDDAAGICGRMSATEAAQRMCTLEYGLLATFALAWAFAVVGSRDAPVVRWRSQDAYRIVVTVTPFNPVLRGVVEKWTAMLELKPLGHSVPVLRIDSRGHVRTMRVRWSGQHIGCSIRCLEMTFMRQMIPVNVGGRSAEATSVLSTGRWVLRGDRWRPYVAVRWLVSAAESAVLGVSSIRCCCRNSRAKNSMRRSCGSGWMRG